MRYRFLLILSTLLFCTTLIMQGQPSSAPVPNITSGIYTSIYGGKEGLENAGAWGEQGGNGTASYEESDEAVKITLSPTLTANNNCYQQYTLSNTIDARANGCDYFHVDLFFENQNIGKQFRILFYPSPNTNADWGYAFYESPIIETSKIGTSWVSVDIPISEIGGNTPSGYATKDQILADIKSIRFNNMASNAGVAQKLTVWVDNMYFYKKDDSLPTTAALSPPTFSTVWPSDKVTSIFSDAKDYGNMKESSLSFFPQKEDFYIDGDLTNKIWKFSNTDDLSIAGLNVSGKEYLHLDVWTKEAQTFQIRLNGSTSYTYPSSTSSYSTSGANWLPIDIKLPSGLNTITQIKILSNTQTSYFLDNIYFYDSSINPAETLSASELNKRLGSGINLGNCFEDEAYKTSGNIFNPIVGKDLIDEIVTINTVADGNKFDHIRIPVRWDSDNRLATVADTNGEYPIRPDFLEDVRSIVDYSIEKGLRVVLNVHHFNPLYAAADNVTNYAYEKARFLSIWRQLSKTFGHYDQDKLYFEILNEPRKPMTGPIWNALIPEALSVIRESGKNNTIRPVLVATAEWGGFPHLDQLVWPENDNYLIGTVHIYSPSYVSKYEADYSTTTMHQGIDWWDTADERNLLESFFEVADRFQQKHPAVPIHVGEYGVYKTTDTDTRVLSLTYQRNAFKKRGYSYCYWEFRAGFGLGNYNYNTKEMTYNQPVVDAVLSNPMPQPAKHNFVRKGEPIYDMNRDGKGVYWTNGGTFSNNTIYKDFVKSESDWGFSSGANFPLAQNEAGVYRISFKAFATDPDGHYRMIVSSTSKKLEFVVSPGGSEWKEYAYTFPLKKGADATSFQVYSNKLITEEGKTIRLTIKDFVVEEVERRHEAAPIPEVSSVENIYSTHFPTTNPLTFSDANNQSFVKDNSSEAKEIIQFTNFSSQTITPSTEITLSSDKRILHLNAYAGSLMKGLTVTVSGDGGSVSQSFDLPSHEWQHLGIPLGNLTSITDIHLSETTEQGRKLFLDHVFVQSGDVLPNIKTIEAAPIPEQEEENVLAVYSTKYGITEGLLYSAPTQQTTIKDSHGEDVLQFNQFTTQAISTEEGFEIGDKNHFHLSFYPEAKMDISIKLVSGEWEFISPATTYLADQWYNIDLDIDDYVAQTQGEIDAIYIISNQSEANDYSLYVDHLFFYYKLVITEDTPDVPAYLPPVIASDKLKAVFSNYYTTTVPVGFSNQPTTWELANDAIWRFKNASDFSILLESLAVSDMTHLHLDIWTGEAADFVLYLDDNLYLDSQTTTGSTWLRLDIPLGELTTINTIRIAGSKTNYYLDNVFFYKDESPFTPNPIANVNTGLGRGMNLGGLLDQAETAYSLETIKAYIDQIAASGDEDHRFGHVRLPIDWTITDRYMTSSPNNLSPAFIKETIQPIVDYILAKNLNLVLSLPSHATVAGQIADYFRYYPETLLFEITDDTPLEAIRTTNSERAVIINNSDNLPADDHLIASIEYTNSSLSLWQDTQEERDIIDAALPASSSIPIYIRAFGISTQADMDSRSLWTTYVARYLETEGYSWAYWNFTGDNGIYDASTAKYQTPLIDALLYNAMPEETVLGEGNPTAIYASNGTTISGDWDFFDNYKYNSVLFDDTDCEFTLTFKNSSFSVEGDFQLYLKEKLRYKADPQYQVRFIAWSDKADYDYKVCVGYTNGEWDYLMDQSSSFRPTTSPKEYNFSFSYSTDSEKQVFFELGSRPTDNVDVLLYLKDIVIEELVETGSVMLAAPEQLQETSDVIPVLSTQYGDDSTITFPTSDPTTVSEEIDSNSNNIKLFSDFDSQNINFTAPDLDDKNNLHISAYPGSVLHLTVEAIYGSYSKKETITLLPHAWNELNINLSSFLEETGGNINEIRFSGGTGSGRKLYLDHIYFYSSIISNETVYANTGDQLSLTATTGDETCTWYEEVNNAFVVIDAQTAGIYSFTLGESSSRKYKAVYSSADGLHEVIFTILPIVTDTRTYSVASGGTLTLTATTDKDQSCVWSVLQESVYTTVADSTRHALVVKNLTSESLKTYRSEYTNASGKYIRTHSITVKSKTETSASQTGTEGEDIILAVAEVTDMIYKWEYSSDGESFVVLENTTYLYTISGAGLTDGGTYRVTWETTSDIYVHTISLSISPAIIPSSNYVWTGAVDSGWNNAANWESGEVPNANSVVYLPGKNITSYPVLTGLKADNVCKDIYFAYGSQLGRSDLLTYEKAHVQLNFGLLDSQNPQIKENDESNPLRYAAYHSAQPIVRNKWHMMSTPLKKVVTGDYATGGYTGTFLRKFNASNPKSGSALSANWTEFHTATNVELRAGEGFIFWMNDFRSAFPYLEYGMEGNKAFGLRQLNGILELPYYEDAAMSQAHRNHEYDAENHQSVFQRFHKQTGALIDQIDYYDRGNQGEAYRFIFEQEGSESASVSYRVFMPDAGEGRFALLGNPYLSSIDFDQFYEDNKTYIDPSYQLWTGDSFSAYSVPTGEGSGGTETPASQLIAPMQSFLVQLKEGIVPPEGVELTFHIENITPAAISTSATLKSTESNRVEELLSITATNSVGSIRTFVARNELGGNEFNSLETPKLLSSVRKVPDLYFLKPLEAGSSQMLGVSYSIIGKESVELPIALATTTKGENSFTFKGMNTYLNAEIVFVDKETGHRKNISAMEAYEYPFNYTPQIKDGQVVADEERFALLIHAMPSHLEELADESPILIGNNPNGWVEVFTSENDPIQSICIYDALGRMLYEKSNIGSSRHEISSANLPHSFAIVRVVTNNGRKKVEKIKVQ